MLLGKIPSKGEARKFAADASSNVRLLLNDIDEEGAYSVWLYYKPGVQSTIMPAREVIRDNSFTRIRARSRNINDDRVQAWVNLDNVSLATQINYILRIESSVGNLIMDHITFEMNTRPELHNE